jgi:sarcosine oxidase, subunit beta
MTVRTTDVAIVGGGIHGCSTALHLAKTGARALVLEKHHVGGHASGNNAGGVRTLMRREAEIPLALAALDLWHGIEDLVEDRCGFQACGQIEVAESEAGAGLLRARLARMRELGYAHERWIDPPELFERVPRLARHCLGGVLAERDGAASPYRSTFAFRRRAEALGQQFLEGAGVVAIAPEGSGWRLETTQGRVSAGAVVNCAGAWADRIAAQAGEPVPFEAAALMLLVTLRMPAFLAPVIITPRLSFKQTPDGTLIIGGGHKVHLELESERTGLDYGKVWESARAVLGAFPVMDGAVVNRGWAGIEGFLPDGLPVIGPSLRARNLFHQFGFSAHGFELGPIVGKIVADLVVHGACDFPIAPFSIGRFQEH